MKKKDFSKKFKDCKKKLLQHKNIILIILLILIPLFFSVYFRSFPIYLPVAQDWAENNVMNFYRSQVEQQVNAQYPNLPDVRKQELVEQQFSQFMEDSPGQIEEQIRQNANYLKEQFGNEDGTYLLAIDSYYYYRHARNLVEKGHIADEIVDGEHRDTYMVYPIGRGAPKFDFHTYVIAWTYFLLSIFGFSLMQSAFVVPIFVAAIGVIPAFFIAKKIAGKIAGFFAAMMYALHQSILTRTIGGFSDTDGYNVVFPLLIVWLFLESLYAKTLKSRLIYAGLASFFVGLFSLAWNGWWYSFAIVLATVIGYLIFISVKEFILHKKIQFGKNPREIAITGGIFFVLSGLLISLFNMSFRKFTSFIYGPFSFLFLKDVGSRSIWPNVFTTVAELKTASVSEIVNSMYGNLFFFLALVGIVFALAPKKKGKLSNYFTIGSILWFFILIYGFGDINQYLFLVALAAPLFAAIIIDLLYNVEIEIRYALLLTIWFIATMFATFSGIRFTLVLAPAYSISFGLFVAFLIKKLSVISEKEFNVSKALSVGVLFILALFLLNTPYSTAKNIGLNQVPSMNDGWFNALNKINMEASDHAVINSWWDFGHWFKAIGNRPVTFDGASQNRPQAHWVGKVLLTSNEKEAVGILRMLDCGGNTAFNIIEEITNDSLEAKLLLDDIILLEESSATSFLLDKGFGSSDVNKIVENTHCSKLPENYFITSYDMIGKSGVWGHFGAWNFTRSTIVNTIRNNNNRKEQSVQALIDRFGYSSEVAEDYFFEVIGASDVQNWIAPWPSFASQVSSCSVQEDLLVCQNGLAINMTNNEPFLMTQSGQVKPEKFSFVDSEGEFRIVEFNENTIPYGAALFRSGNSYQSILMEPQLTGAMFTRLYFFDGVGMNNFEKFTEESLVTGGKTSIWKVLWDGENFIEEEEEMVNNSILLMKTNYGEIEIELFNEKSPITVANFLSYVQEGYYSGTIFHRVIPGFMIQGGGFLPSGEQKETKSPITLEASLSNERGTLAMARTNNPNSATSQFFINTVDNNFLNPSPGNDGYAVFGKVISGMDIVDQISGVRTSSKDGFDDWPIEDVIIEEIILQ